MAPLYTFRVQSVNRAGPSLDWSPSRQATATTPPSEVQALTQAASVDGNGRPTKVTASWAPPSSWGGGTFVRYEYRFSLDGNPVNGGRWAQTTGTQVDFTDVPALNLLRPRFTLSVEVRAVTSSGTGPSVAHPTQTYTRVTEPGAPRDVRFDAAAAGATSVRVHWTRPAQDGGTATLTYEYQLNGNGPWVSTSTATSVDLPVDTSAGPVTLEVVVRAISTYGEPGTSSARARITVDPRIPDHPLTSSTVPRERHRT